MCFTPKVTLTTFAIEWILAGITWVKYGMTTFGRITMILLLLLGGFQITEYLSCRTSTPLLWARLGFVCITWLPALGLHLTSMLNGRSWLATRVAYLLSIYFTLRILIDQSFVTSAACAINYVLYGHSQAYFGWYGLYYFGFLVWAAIELFQSSQTPSKHRRAQQWLLAGYLTFLTPTFFVSVVFPAWRIAIPSIMCGFAILLAFILLYKVLPAYERR